ncbi:MAG: DUF2975 domain-containing protein [Eubacteriales bacterium]|nr:DUF2975 domain-containing protein [Eubacteriales bacterium]
MKSIQKQLKLLGVIVAVSLLALFSITALIMVYLPKLSLEVAKMYTAEAHMRVPVLIQSELAMGLFLVICLLGLNVLRLVVKGEMYSNASAKTLLFIALCFLGIGILQLVFIFYIRSQVGGSITNIYSALIAFGCVAAAALFTLFNRLTVQGMHYKQDSELTI